MSDPSALQVLFEACGYETWIDEETNSLMVRREETMKTSSCKNKGRIGQQEVIAEIKKVFPQLTDGDIKSTSMGCGGEDVFLSTAARHVLPVSIEVKRGKAINLIKACKQAEENCNGWMPVAAGRYDHDKQWYACIHLEDLLYLLKQVYG